MQLLIEAAEDGHVAELQVRRAVRRDEARYDVRENGLDGGHGAFAGVDAGHVREKHPRLSFLARVYHVVQSDRELQDRRRRCPTLLWRHMMSVLRPGLLRQDGVCLARLRDLHQHVQRATVHAESDRRECHGLHCVALQGLFDAAAPPPDLMQPAGGLVDVHDAVCADSVRASASTA